MIDILRGNPLRCHFHLVPLRYTVVRPCAEQERACPGRHAISLSFSIDGVSHRLASMEADGECAKSRDVEPARLMRHSFVSRGTRIALRAGAIKVQRTLLASNIRRAALALTSLLESMYLT